MKNLKNYGVQELNASEIRETGGGLLYILAMQALGSTILYGAFMAGYNAGASA
ncbi:hypothetical protein R8G61_11360 [Tenacibaculum maritimum]